MSTLHAHAPRPSRGGAEPHFPCLIYSKSVMHVAPVDLLIIRIASLASLASLALYTSSSSHGTHCAAPAVSFASSHTAFAASSAASASGSAAAFRSSGSGYVSGGGPAGHIGSTTSGTCRLWLEE